ncbi:hypothetical protein AV530_005714 [Patagioenas fasciata monilis]|uniref:Uncharacterized protein n=1 Tax=Patagioenas fasciata monilis TaxID=372326 RepID=A0A1V4JMS2_PATFA|nr:hypothetical protein AV530_005714 [Patagioenas fasciata monilis]
MSYRKACTSLGHQLRTRNRGTGSSSPTKLAVWPHWCQASRVRRHSEGKDTTTCGLQIPGTCCNCIFPGNINTSSKTE